MHLYCKYPCGLMFPQDRFPKEQLLRKRPSIFNKYWQKVSPKASQQCLSRRRGVRGRSPRTRAAPSLRSQWGPMPRSRPQPHRMPSSEHAGRVPPLLFCPSDTLHFSQCLHCPPSQICLFYFLTLAQGRSSLSPWVCLPFGHLPLSDESLQAPRSRSVPPRLSCVPLAPEQPPRFTRVCVALTHRTLRHILFSRHLPVVRPK